MSDSAINIISINPKDIPTLSKTQEAIDLLTDEYPSCEIISKKYDEVRFVDMGENFGRIFCNLCGQEIKGECWGEKMTEAFEINKFEDLDFDTDCCGKKGNLNDLKYQWDCGFASYSISINNPDFDQIKESKIKKKLSEIFGFEVKLFWSRI